LVLIDYTPMIFGPVVKTYVVLRYKWSVKSWLKFREKVLVVEIGRWPSVYMYIYTRTIYNPQSKSRPTCLRPVNWAGSIDGQLYTR